MASAAKRQRPTIEQVSPDTSFSTSDSDKTLFGGRDDDERAKDGYGHNIYPMTTLNIWNKGNKTFIHTIKTSKYLDFNFADSQSPFVIPYTAIGFWTSMYDQKNINLNNTLNFLPSLEKISFGVSFLHASIEIEVFNITRQRLIQSGSTSVLTYDFETSQNLIIAIYSRLFEGINFTSKDDTSPLKHHDVENIFDPNNDHTTKKEVPLKHKYIFNVNFPQLTHNYYWKPINFASVNYWRTLIPGAQGMLVFNKNTNITSQAELLTNTLKPDSYTILQSTIQNRQSYPLLTLAQPKVPDETGFMKFRYQLRINTKLHLKYHLQPDFADNDTNTMLTRQVITITRIIDTIWITSSGCISITFHIIRNTFIDPIEKI